MALLNALSGAIGFLTRLPVGHDERSWTAFFEAPWTFPIVGALVGVLLALVFVLPAPAPVAAFLFVLAIVAITGINHADGLADLGDAAVVHGDAERRRTVLKDSSLGVGGTLALALLVVGLTLAGLSLAEHSLAAAVVIVVPAEVGTKLGMALLACIETAPHDGLGRQLTASNSVNDLSGTIAVVVLPFAFAGPVVLLIDPWLAVASTLVAGVSIAAGTAAALALGRWSRAALGGVNGDVLGAANELGRLAGLYAGILTWGTLADSGAFWRFLTDWLVTTAMLTESVLLVTWVGAPPVLTGVVLWTRW